MVRVKKKRYSKKKGLLASNRLKFLLIGGFFIFTLLIASGTDLFAAYSFGGEEGYSVALDFTGVGVGPELYWDNITGESAISVVDDMGHIIINPDGAPVISSGVMTRADTGYPSYELRITDFKTADSFGNSYNEPISYKTEQEGSSKVVYYNVLATYAIQTKTDMTAGTTDYMVTGESVSRIVSAIPALKAADVVVDISIKVSTGVNAKGILKIYDVTLMPLTEEYARVMEYGSSVESFNSVLGFELSGAGLGVEDAISTGFETASNGVTITAGVESGNALEGSVTVRNRIAPAALFAEDGSVSVKNVIQRFVLSMTLAVETSLYDDPVFSWANTPIIFSTEEISLLFIAVVIILIISTVTVFMLKRTRIGEGTFFRQRRERRMPRGKGKFAEFFGHDPTKQARAAAGRFGHKWVNPEED